MDYEEPEWTFEHSVDCKVSAQFAWDFWTNVNNWTLDPDVESVVIDGPFQAGTRGFTNSKTSGNIQWRIIEVCAGNAVIEFPLSGAVGRLAWTFEDVGGSTKITQRCTLQGEQAYAYAKAVAASLEAGVPAGMKRLCTAMEHATAMECRSTVGNKPSIGS